MSDRSMTRVHSAHCAVVHPMYVLAADMFDTTDDTRLSLVHCRQSLFWNKVNMVDMSKHAPLSLMIGRLLRF